MIPGRGDSARRFYGRSGGPTLGVKLTSVSGNRPFDRFMARSWWMFCANRHRCRCLEAASRDLIRMLM